MNTALFINKKDKLGKISDKFIKIYTFKLDYDTINSVESEIIHEKDLNYIALLLLSKQVNELYVYQIDEETRNFLIKIGIIVRTQQELEASPLFSSFLFE
ncbi:MAG: hypothetical protein LBL90_01005 [Prevotellaceae bacterium]|jgi:hypothetical protein|nr:hypothetical protein [Prevotellaceae bacterium]